MSDAWPDIVARDEWVAARKTLLLKEKAMTRARDALNAERRRLPLAAPTHLPADGGSCTTSIDLMYDANGGRYCSTLLAR